MKKSSLLLFLTLSIIATHAQLVVPRSSPFVKETHRIGITDISIAYSSPKVAGRKIWGTLVPYQSDIPWRAGANESTVIEFTDDVVINGKPLAKGKYSLLIIPSEKAEWTIVLSSQANLWGGYYYKREEDALRIQVKPIATSFREYLSYEFSDKSTNSVTIALEWEKLRIPFNVEIDVVNTTLANFRSELRGPKGNDAGSWITAARFCLRHKTNYEEALTWADRAIKGGYGGGFARRDFSTLFLKAQILERLSRKDEARIALAEAVTLIRTPGEYSDYGDYFMEQNQSGEAIKIYQTSVTKHPLYWLYAEYANALLVNGELDRAIEMASKAVDLAPPEYRPIHEDQLKTLQSKKTKK